MFSSWLIDWMLCNNNLTVILYCYHCPITGTVHIVFMYFLGSNCTWPRLQSVLSKYTPNSQEKGSGTSQAWTWGSRILYFTINPLLHRYLFSCINNRQLLKTLWEKKKLLIMSNFFLSHNVFYSIRKLYPHLSIFMTSYLYLLLNWKSPKFQHEVKG